MDGYDENTIRGRGGYDSETGEIIRRPNTVAPRMVFDAAQVALIKRTLMPKGFGDQELDLFLYHARRTGLDPLARQIYAMDVKGKFSVQVSIDGFRLMAERSGVYAGQLGPYWCGSDSVWRDVWLEKEAPAAARVAVLRSDFKEPLWATARFVSYAGGYNWQKMPDVMIAKVAEALALRRAFPQELSGLYTNDEMQQASENNSERAEKPPASHPATRPQKTLAPDNPLDPAYTPPPNQADGKVVDRAEAWDRYIAFKAAVANSTLDDELSAMFVSQDWRDLQTDLIALGEGKRIDTIIKMRNEKMSGLA